MYKIAKFIVEKRILFIILFLGACIYSGFAMQKVTINYDLTHYLPKNSETKIALDVMEDQFGLNGVANVAIEDVTPEQASDIRDQISQIDGVLNASFENNNDYYKNGNALIKITLKEGDYSPETKQAIYSIRDLLSDYHIEMNGSSVHAVDMLDDVNHQMTIILLIAIPIIILILFLNANSYAEILVFGIVVGASVIINKGTNLFLGNISYVTNSIAIVLQLALAMDYSIILLHRFEEEKKKYPANEAIIHALKNSIPSISSSSLTTIVGMIAIMFMHYTIGFDIGIVLAKSILSSLLSVFLLMPGILLIFNGWIKKTQHKNFIPQIKFIPQYIIKTRRFMPIVMLCVISIAFYIQLNNSYNFNFNENKSQSLINSFGKTNTLAIIVPKGNDVNEQKVVDYIEKNPYVNDANGISSLGIRDELTPEEFAQKTNMDLNRAYGIYAYYKQSQGQQINSIQFSKLITFMKENQAILGLTNDQMSQISQIDRALNVDSNINAQTFASLLNLSSDEANLIYSIYEMSLDQQTYKMANLIDYMDINHSALGLTEDEWHDIQHVKSVMDMNNQPISDTTFAQVLGIDSQDAYKIYVLYEMNTGKTNYGISDIIHFMNQNQESLGLTQTQITQINQAMYFSENKDTKMNSTDFAQVMGISDNEAAQLYTMYNQVNSSSDEEIAMGKMIDFMYTNHNNLTLTAEQMSQLIYSFYLVNNIPMNENQFSEALQIESNQALGIYAQYAMSTGYEVNNETLNNLIPFMDQMSSLLNLSAQQKTQMDFLQTILDHEMDEMNPTTFADIMSLNVNQVDGIYGYYQLSLGGNDSSYSLTDIIQYMVNHSQLLKLTDTQISQLNQLQQILNIKTQPISEDDFSSIMQMNSQDVSLLYSIYEIKTNSQTYRFIDLMNYLYDNKDNLNLSTDEQNQIIETKTMMDTAINNFESNDYSRILFNINLNVDDKRALDLIKDLSVNLKQYYHEYYVLGDSANIQDIKDSFNQDVFYVNFITIISILVILVLTFRSFIIPFILVFIIQGSIWINFAFSTVSHTSIMFIGYIIVTAIQMGATIDYAIVVTERYRQFRKDSPKNEAIKKAIQASIPTILTSGGILIVSGFSVGIISTIPTISSLGILIGRGATISFILVIFLLPQLLFIFDKVFYKEKQRNLQ